MVFFLCANAAYAATQASSGWVFSGETVKVENRAFTFLMTNETVTVDYVTDFLKLQNNTCDMTEHVRFCVNNIEYNHITDRIRADVDVYTLKPTITMTRTISEAGIVVSQEVTITVTIANTGDARATNVVFTDAFPSELEITEHEIVRKEGNSAKWTGSISPDITETFIYKIKAKDNVETSIKGKLSYYDGFETKTVYSGALSITATPFFTLIPSFGRTTIYTGETTNYSVNMSNAFYWNASKKLKVDALELVVDRGLEITEKPGTVQKVGENIYRWSGDIAGNHSKAVLVKVKGLFVPGGSIYAKAYYTDPDGTSRETSQYKTTLTVEKKGTSITSNIEDETLEAYEEKRLQVWLQNLNPAAALKNVVVNVSSDFAYMPNTHYSTLLLHQRKLVVDKIIYGPAVTTSTSYKLEVNASYQTEFGDNGTDTYLTTFSVAPIKDLEVSQTINPTEIESKETASVTIAVRNPRLTNIKNVEIKDNFSDELKTTGITSTKMNLNKETTVIVYTYIITGPSVKNATTYTINTTVYYDDERVNDTYRKKTRRSYSEAASLKVTPQTLLLTVTKTISGTLYKGTITDVDYVIENPSPDTTAKDITIHFPLSQDYDFAGKDTTFSISTLGPGENFYVYGKEKIRSKYNGSSLKIPKTKVTYTNEDGAAFDSNSTELAKEFLYKYTDGPDITAEINASDEVNDTNAFDVGVTIRNTGNEYADVNATDGEHSWEVALSPNSKKTFTYKKLMPTTGVYDLPQVKASYSYKNSSFITGSNTERVTVASKPLIEIKKSVTGQTNNVDNFTVKLNIKNTGNEPLQNISVKDDGNEWLIKSLKDEAELTYQKRITELGSATLPKANISYTHNNNVYKADSEEAQVEITSKEVITAKKEASEEDANQSQPVTIQLVITNHENRQMDNVKVIDGERQWTINLTAKEQKVLEYSMAFGEVEEKTLPAATIRYVYNNEEYEAKTNTKTIRIHEFTALETKKPGEKPESVIEKIFWYIKKALTWKRGA